MMGSPLNSYELLSFILYCNGECNYDLSKSQRQGKVSQKWRYFDYFLNISIEKLHNHEKHNENIYTGVCGVAVDFTDIEKRKTVSFKSNVSFSTDLKIAQEFKGDEGIILGLNMQRSIFCKIGLFYGCDVSWISGFPHEKEILVRRNSRLVIYKSKLTQFGKNQWVVCDEGNSQETSFQSMFICPLAN